VPLSALPGGARLQIEGEALRWPPAALEALRGAEPGVVAQPPFAPEAASSQWPLMLQRAHRHPLLTGHALWVARVRPAAWDARWGRDQAIGAFQALERGQHPGGAPLPGAALRALSAQGVRWFLLDPSAFVTEQLGLASAYRGALTALCGRPWRQAEGLSVWDLSRCDPRAAASVAWAWPDGLRPGGPERPVEGVHPDAPSRRPP
jgi:hypothetical protein